MYRITKRYHVYRANWVSSKDTWLFFHGLIIRATSFQHVIQICISHVYQCISRVYKNTYLTYIQISISRKIARWATTCFPRKTCPYPCKALATMQNAAWKKNWRRSPYVIFTKCTRTQAPPWKRNQRDPGYWTVRTGFWAILFDWNKIWCHVLNLFHLLQQQFLYWARGTCASCRQRFHGRHFCGTPTGSFTCHPAGFWEWVV